MIVGTGIDIVEIFRMKKAHERWGERFFKRILTTGELAHLKDRRDVYPYVSSRFAAKEAFVKALGTGFSQGLSWMDLEVKRERGQRPFFNISGMALAIMEQNGVKNVHLSMSHERAYAVAQVILEG
jgi:holo-[acyl-carrier protein] synthase